MVDLPRPAVGGARGPGELDARRLLGYLQTHDQVGNRALGERIGMLTSAGRQAAGAAMYLLWTGTPMVFMGEEWAASTPWQFFTSYPDESLGAEVREGRRAEFSGHGWSADQVPDPQDPATRDRSVLPWAELGTPPHARMLRWYAGLVRLRRDELDGETRLADVAVSLDEEARWVVMRHRALSVAANLGADEQVVPLGGDPAEVVLAWDEHRAGLVMGDEGCGIRLPPDSVAVVTHHR